MRTRHRHRRQSLIRQLSRRDWRLFAVLALAGSAGVFWFGAKAGLPGEAWPWSAAVGVVFAVLALNAFVDARRRRAWARTMRGVDNLLRLDWRQFERWTAEAYRAQGYTVRLVGGGGADGGVDLVCTRSDGTCLVQCKHWRGSVGAKTVREMYGLMHHHGAGSADIVALKGFTRDAKAFAKGKPMRLLDGKAAISVLHGGKQ